jgi:flagellar biosynthesis GTPase FlhF
MSYVQRLAKLKSAWVKSKPATGGSLPEGKYQFTIKKAQVSLGTQEFNKGHIMVTYQLEVATGPLKGRRAKIAVDLESEGLPDKNVPPGMDIFKGHLEMLQIDIPKMLDEKTLKKILESMIGIVFDGVAVLNKKGYTNIYINSLTNAAPDEDDDEEEEEEEEEEESEDEEDEESEDDEEEDEDSDEEESDDEEEEEEEDDEDDEDEEEEEKPKAKKPPAKEPAPAAKKGGFKLADKVGAKKPAAKAEAAKGKVKPKADEDEDDWEF